MRKNSHYIHCYFWQIVVIDKYSSTLTEYNVQEVQIIIVLSLNFFLFLFVILVIEKNQLSLVRFRLVVMNDIWNKSSSDEGFVDGTAVFVLFFLVDFFVCVLVCCCFFLSVCAYDIIYKRLPRKFGWRRKDQWSFEKITHSQRNGICAHNVCGNKIISRQKTMQGYLNKIVHLFQ